MTALAGKVALITGASRGIGRAIVMELAAAGMKVGLLARPSDELDSICAEVEATGAAVVGAPADLADAATLRRATEIVAGAFGPIDVLVNNAALLGPLGPTVTLDADEIAFVMAVNVVAPIRLSLLLVPGMIERGYGRVMNVSSGVVNRARDGEPHNTYITSKTALEAHTFGLAAELAGTGVTANVFWPGGVDTRMASVIRDLDPNVVGVNFVARNVERFEKGMFLAPEVPAKVLRETLEGDENGVLVSTPDRI